MEARGRWREERLGLDDGVLWACPLQNGKVLVGKRPHREGILRIEGSRVKMGSVGARRRREGAQAVRFVRRGERIRSQRTSKLFLYVSAWSGGAEYNAERRPSSAAVGSDAPSTMSAHTTPTKPQGDIIMRSSTPPMPRGKSPELVPPPSSPSSPLLSRSTRPESSPASRSPIPPPQLSEAEEEVYLISEETSALLKSEEVWKKEQDEFRAREGEEFDG